MTPDSTGLPDRTPRLDAFLAEQGLAAVWFARPLSFAWVTGGSNVVDRSSDVGVAAVGYDGDAFTVVTDNIEAQRLRTEVLPGGTRIETFDWYASSLGATVAARSSSPAVADFDVPGMASFDPASLRQPLDSADIEAYRHLGREVADEVERECRNLAPTDTERAAATRIRAALFERGIETPVVLVAGGERARAYRHFLPTDSTLDTYALVSVTAARGGLHASLTRTVAFEAPDWLRERTTATARVEVTALAATRASGGERTAADVFDDIQEAYTAVGWPDEWKRHHQGGADGYAGREWIAMPTCDVPIRLPMAFAWNPTIRGAKSEDTAVVGTDGVEVLTTTDSWPTLEVTAVDVDFTMPRHGVLSR